MIYTFADAWGHLWVKKKVFVYTDNASCQAGLRRQTLRGAAFWPLRQTLLHSAQLDIFIEPIWIPGHTNVLADALSRFNFDQVVNLSVILVLILNRRPCERAP